MTVTLHFHPRCHDAWTAGQEPSLPSVGLNAAP
jgi:hypothetical protein